MVIITLRAISDFGIFCSKHPPSFFHEHIVIESTGSRITFRLQLSLIVLVELLNLYYMYDPWSLIFKIIKKYFGIETEQ